ncbi:hypothetical protein HDU96_009430 [Phlyctochytrium bullatum]|nr:hypothetical protein HDU96_009430 [Phlyctochytrium bullatum]
MDPSNEVSVLSSFVNSLNSAMVYNTLMWYVNRTNNNPSVLPDTRIELVPLNSRLDRGTSLTGAQQLINQDRVAAIIGESNSRNTVTMGLAAAVSNVLHCANLATTPQLSSKVDYPTTFRTQSSASLQARSMLALIRRYNKTSNVGILASADEFGAGVTQFLQLYASQYNVTVSLATSYDINKADYKDELRPFQAGKIQTILLVTAQFPVVTMMASARELGMLSGDHWFVTTTGWSDGMFASADGQKILADVQGVWQVQTPLYDDVAVHADGSNEEAVAMRQWWSGLFVSNDDERMPGVSKTFNPSWIFPANSDGTSRTLTTNCANDTQLNVATAIPNFVYRMNNTLMAGAGNQCTGQDNRYMEGYLSLFALQTKYMIVKPTDYQHNTVKCAKMLIGMFDHYTRTGQISVDGINNRTLLSLTNNNISRLINDAKITDAFGRPIYVDAYGDLQMDQDLLVYKYDNVSSRRRVVKAVAVGRWDRGADQVVMTSPADALFSGGRDAPPVTPEIPVVRFEAKKALRYALNGVVALGSVFTIFLGVYMWSHARMKIFKAASPLFLGFILLGANVSYGSVFLFSIYPMTDLTCITVTWLKYAGFAIVFGALMVKTYRIHLIFTNSKRNVSRRLTDARMTLHFGVFLALWCAVLATWTVLPSQRPFVAINSVARVKPGGDAVESYFETPTCSFNDFNYVGLGFMAVTLLIGAWLAYAVRSTPNAFNESKWIAVAVYNWAVLGIVLNAISNFAVKDPDVIFVMEAVEVILTQTVVAGVLFVPKIVEIRRGRGNAIDDTMGNWDSSSDKLGGSFRLYALPNGNVGPATVSSNGRSLSANRASLALGPLPKKDPAVSPPAAAHVNASSYPWNLGNTSSSSVYMPASMPTPSSGGTTPVNATTPMADERDAWLEDDALEKHRGRSFGAAGKRLEAEELRALLRVKEEAMAKQEEEIRRLKEKLGEK